MAGREAARQGTDGRGSTAPGRLLVVFLDGVGIGEDDPDVNPIARAVLPTLDSLLGGTRPTLDAPRPSGTRARAFPIDATLGVPGTPQSGTGQTALLTGENAPRLHGRHFGPWVPVALRPLVRERSFLRRAGDRGRAVAFANAYPRGWPGPRGGRRIAGPPLAAEGAGLLTRHEEALGEGRAVSSEIVNDGWRRHLGHAWLPRVEPEDAGANLAAVTWEADLTLYAHYATDQAGHRGGMAGGVAALERVDRFLGGLLAELSDDVTVLIVSDHGNLEDVRTGHTLNPALGVAVGPGSAAAASIATLTDVSGFALRHLRVSV